MSKDMSKDTGSITRDLMAKLKAYNKANPPKFAQKPINDLIEEIGTTESFPLPPGIIEAPQNIPENESGTLKIISE